TEYPHQGTLAFSEVSVDPSTGSFAVRVVVDNPDQILMPGMYVNAIVGSGVRQNAILVPQQGIARDPKGNTSAMVVNDQGLVEVRPVRVSRAIGNNWLVEEGLVAGDRVIVEGLQKIQPGIPVQVVEAAGTPAAGAAGAAPDRSEERRVGKECRSRWAPYHERETEIWRARITVVSVVGRRLVTGGS